MKIAIKMVKWIIYFLPVNFASDRMMSHVHGLAAKTQSFKMVAFEVPFFETNFFRIAGIPETDETSVSGEAEC